MSTAPQPGSTAPQPGSATATTTAGEAVATTTVTISNLAFHPAVIKVKSGEIVTWTNEDAGLHTVEIGGVVSPALQRGQAFKYTFRSPGTYAYIAADHPNMHGTVLVTG